MSTIVFGLTASTRSSLTDFRGEGVPRLDPVDSRLAGMGGRLGGIDTRLGGLETRLDRIITILDERLPHPAV